jgi:hypothetical protein
LIFLGFFVSNRAIRLVSFKPTLGFHSVSLIAISLGPFTVAEYIPATDGMGVPGVYPPDLDDGVLCLVHMRLQPVLVGHTESLAASVGYSGLGLDFPLPHRGNENGTEVSVFLAQGVFIRGERGFLVFCESLFHAARLKESVKKV